jgi:MFS family permease
MDSFIDQFGKHTSAVHGILVSCILLCAALSSSFAGRLADRLGRPKAMAFGVGVFTVGVVMEAAAVKLSMFAVGRVIEGLGYGLYFSTQTVYICEISPPKSRGPLTSGPHFMTCLALVVGYFISYGTVNIPGSLSWRLPFIILGVMAIFYLLVNLFFLPESPRWLIRHRDFRAAEKVWDILEVKQEDREADEGASTSEERPMTLPLQSNPPGEGMQQNVNFRSLWTRDVRKQTFLAVFLMGFLQLCGIDAVLYVGSFTYTAIICGLSDVFFSSMRRSFFSTLAWNLKKPHSWLVSGFFKGHDKADLVSGIGIRCVCNFNRRDKHSCNTDGRQMGSPYQYSSGRSWPDNVPDLDWQSLRWPCRFAYERCRSLGGHRVYLSILHCASHDLGH